MSALEVAAPPSPLTVPGQRGRTAVADRVVAQIATRAVAEVGQAGGAGRPLIGLMLGRQADEGPARATARVNGNLAMIEMRLSLAYPAPVRSLTREVRRHVMERVTSLTGLEVRHVDIEVARLLRGSER